MPVEYSYCAVPKSRRSAIHVVRVHGKLLQPLEVEELAERLRSKLTSRGEPLADIVVVQGDNKQTLRLSGESFSVSRVRAAMFNAAISWTPIEL
jgi:hypothetical protein